VAGDSDRGKKKRLESDRFRRAVVKIAIEYVGRLPDEIPMESLAELLAYAQLEKPPVKL
jgi:hypothetical protein